MELFFKLQFVKKSFVYVFGVFIFSFCSCFHEGFIHKIILVSRFLPIKVPLSRLVSAIRFRLIFKFDTRSLRVLCIMPLLKTLSRLPQSTAFLCLILFLMFVCHSFPFCAFSTMIYWTLIEVLLNLFAPLDSLNFEQINVF